MAVNAGQITVSPLSSGGGGGGGGVDVTYDTIANRPAANTVSSGDRFVATDIGIEYWSDGASWYLVDLGDSVIETKTFTYFMDGNINTISGANDTLSYTYTAGGDIATISSSAKGWTKTFAYSGDDVQSITVS